MSKKWKTVLVLVAILVGAVGARVTPLVVGHLLNPPDEGDRIYRTSRISREPAGPEIEIFPEVTVHAPRTIRVTQTKNISIIIGKYSLRPSGQSAVANSSIISDNSSKTDNRAAKSYTVDFKVADDAGLVCAEPKEKRFPAEESLTETLTWYCTMHPKQAADYSILISGLPPRDLGAPTATDATGKEVNEPSENLFLINGILSIPITALTAQGIPARLWAWLQALGACVGFVGTVLSYPIFKSRSQKKLRRKEEMRQNLGIIQINITAMHNELIQVFSPYLHPENLKNKRDRDEHFGAVENFAFRRDYRPKVEGALASITKSEPRTSGRVRQCLTVSENSVNRFLEVVSGKSCFRADIKSSYWASELQATDWLPDLPQRIEGWMQESKEAHDEAIRVLGEALAELN